MRILAENDRSRSGAVHDLSGAVAPRQLFTYSPRKEAQGETYGGGRNNPLATHFSRELAVSVVDIPIREAEEELKPERQGRGFIPTSWHPRRARIGRHH
jgi:hypothetical protein